LEAPLILILIVETILPSSRVRDLSLLDVLNVRDMLLKSMLLLLCMVSLELGGLLMEHSLLVLVLVSLLQGRLLVWLGILQVLLGDGRLILLRSIASVGPWVDRGWHSGPGHGCGGVESWGYEAGSLLHGGAAVDRS
jgi:hypothetical protein